MMLFAKRMPMFQASASVLLIVVLYMGYVFAEDDRGISRTLDNSHETDRHQDEREDRKKCPIRELGEAIEAVASVFSEKEGRLQVEALQNYTQHKYGGSWAVVLSEYKSAVNESFHWRIPALKIGRKRAFCIKTIGYWMYCVAKVH